MTYNLREAEDGWASVSEAQNAAASYALACLMPDQPMHLVLPAPYAALVKQWQVVPSSLPSPVLSILTNALFICFSLPLFSCFCNSRPDSAQGEERAVQDKEDRRLEKERIINSLVSKKVGEGFSILPTYVFCPTVC